MISDAGLRAVVIGFGATARGAVTALTALGVHDVDVLTTRQTAAVAAPIPATQLVHLDTDPDGASVAETEDGPRPLPEFLAGFDIIVNCVLQDTDAPIIFLHTDDPAPALPRHPDRRRLLRRGHGVQLGPPDHLRRAAVHRRRPGVLLRGRPQPVAPVELGHLGDQ